MNTDPQAGEVWLADLGITGKTRPVLILSFPEETDARCLVVVAALTSQIRRMRGEVEIGKPRWLTKQSAVNVQAIASLDRHKLIRRMGTLSKSDNERVKVALRDLLDLR